MNNEELIGEEAREFYTRNITLSGRSDAITQFRTLKSRLQDFYSDEFKAIFLDEIQDQIVSDLTHHRNEAHNGEPKADCNYEITAERILFYIRQEIGTLPLVAHQHFESNPEQNRNKVFVSYSHKDKEYLVDIQRHFKPFLRHLDYWDDTKIEPGQKWKEEIRKAISETKVAILLVSTDFFGSDFIASDELPPLLKAAEENGAVILVVILKPCLFEEFPNLNQFQAVNPPSKPVVKMDETEREDLFVNLVRQTKRILANP